MKFYEQEISGVWVIEAEPFTDNRGVFRRHFCQQEFGERGIETRICQANISENHRKYTLRGFHYQIEPFAECKTISCMHGAIFDVVADLRPKSQTFLKWISVELNSKNNFSLHIPAGCANAYLTLEDNTIIHYYMSEFYSQESYRGFRYNDPLFGFVWPAEPTVISDRDRSYPDFHPNSVRCPSHNLWSR